MSPAPISFPLPHTPHSTNTQRSRTHRRMRSSRASSYALFSSFPEDMPPVEFPTGTITGYGPVLLLAAASAGAPRSRSTAVLRATASRSMADTSFTKTTPPSPVSVSCGGSTAGAAGAAAAAAAPTLLAWCPTNASCLTLTSCVAPGAALESNACPSAVWLCAAAAIGTQEARAAEEAGASSQGRHQGQQQGRRGPAGRDGGGARSWCLAGTPASPQPTVRQPAHRFIGESI